MRAIIAIGLAFIPFISLTAAEPDPKDLDSVLKAVEERMKGIDNFRAGCTRTVIHPLTKKAETFSGEIIWQRPDRARIDLTHADEVNVELVKFFK